MVVTVVCLESSYDIGLTGFYVPTEHRMYVHPEAGAGDATQASRLCGKCSTHWDISPAPRLNSFAIAKLELYNPKDNL